MNIPGFTAEASLYNVSERYHAITYAPHGGIVQPAMYPDEIVRETNFIPFSCFKWRCQYYHPVLGCLKWGFEYVC